MSEFIDLSFSQQPEVIIDGMTEFDSFFLNHSMEAPLFQTFEQTSSPEHFSGVSSSDTSSPVTQQESPPTEISWMAMPPPSIVAPVVEEKPKSKRGRKKRVLDLTNPDISAVERSREELLRISSNEFEGQIQQLLKVRKLTDAEETEVKRQRRLIKNRESAQNSRSKKKNEMETLEGEVKRLETENKQLEQKVFELTKENTQLKLEVSKLRQLIQKTSGYLPDNLQIGGSSGPSNSTATTVVLFIMLFSFGLFVTNFSGVRSPQNFGSSLMLPPSRVLELPSSHQVVFSSTVGRSLKSQEYIAPQSTQEYTTSAREVLQFGNYERTEPGRVIDFDSCCDNSAGENNNHSGDNNQRSFDRTITKIVVNDEENSPRSFANPKVYAAAADAEPPRIQADVPSPKNINLTLRTFLNEPNPSNLSKILAYDSDIVPHAESSEFLEQIQPRRNTAYFAVHSWEQLFPTGADQMFDPEEPLQLSLLITPEALSLPFEKEYARTPLVEIIAQVLQVNLPKNFEPVPIIA